MSNRKKELLFAANHKYIGREKIFRYYNRDLVQPISGGGSGETVCWFCDECILLEPGDLIHCRMREGRGINPVVASFYHTICATILDSHYIVGSRTLHLIQWVYGSAIGLVSLN